MTRTEAPSAAPVSQTITFPYSIQTPPLVGFFVNKSIGRGVPKAQGFRAPVGLASVQHSGSAASFRERPTVRLVMARKTSRRKETSVPIRKNIAAMNRPPIRMA